MVGMNSHHHAIACLSILLLPLFASAQAFDDEDEELRGGLIAQLTDKDGHQVSRIDEVISFNWPNQSPDVRLSTGPFSVTWTGLLLSDSSGSYQFSAYVEGAITVKIRDRIVLDQQVDHARRILAEPFDLPFNWHPIEITYRSTTESPRISLYWKGPGFQLEPIGSRQYYHDPLDSPDQSWRRGYELASAMKCNACHVFPALGPFEAAPDLSRLAGNLYPEWLVERLAGDRVHDEFSVDVRQMPHFDIDREQAESIAAYLFAPTRSSDVKQNAAVSDADDLQAGETLFISLGCLACHQQGELGTSSLFGGGDLSEIASKRPSEFFQKWLKSPAEINRHHRMPTFDLTSRERRQLGAFLSSLGTSREYRQRQDTAEQIDRGKQLYKDFRCAACHTLDQQQEIAVTATPNWESACTGANPNRAMQPRFGLSPSDRAAVETFFSQVSTQLQHAPAAPIDGEKMMVRLNCLGCHARGANAGLGAVLTDVAKTSSDLAPLVPAMTPPSLNSVGDKLYEQALEDAILRKGPPHRPYLMVRMPRFQLTEPQVKTVTQHLIDQDRIMEPELLDEIELDPVIAKVAGTRLVTSIGFGCTSCHQVGDVIPPNAPLNAKGPDISLLGQRIRKPWFDRWVRNPSRIIRGQEMPSVQVAVRGVLDDALDAQLASVWKMLNTEGFVPPRPGAVRTVRQPGDDLSLRPYVMTDVMRLEGNPIIKPFVIGLSNRHSLLIDLQENRLIRWWVGDIAGQHTEGKTWFWEPAGTDLFIDPTQSSEIRLLGHGTEVPASRMGQFATEVDRWQHEGNGLAYAQRLHFAVRADHARPDSARPDDSSTDAVVLVRQQVTPFRSEGRSGFERSFVMEQIPPGYDVAFLGFAPSARRQFEIGRDGRSISIKSPELVSIELSDAGSARFDREGRVILPAEPRGGPIRFSVKYVTAVPVDRYMNDEPELPSQQATELYVAPGIETRRLPLPISFMPTGLAWQPDGDLVVTSLKGRVWIARDTDGDGLEDQTQPVSDELAAPFGAQAFGSYIDVINKFALLRLRDRDADGHFEETVTLASGWGHTEDYHDWSIGLPHDESGDYFIAIPCQQDERSAAGANLRGKVVKLVPRQPDQNDPRRFSNQVVSGGHRFPVGIARNRSGAMFVTDNQGNYNPFNELNHVRDGKRYGFINRLEQSDDFSPELTEPAIDIPHPWTRSVNGICFLETPDGLMKQRKGARFGPFEGHLIGCEYDTRRLIRMSLQKVGDTYQGAAYPFTYDTPVEGEPLLGPLVCQVAPDGDIYVGNIRDSGWGGSNNIGSIARMRLVEEDLPPGIAEVTGDSDGFTIRFTKAVDKDRASRKENYVLSSYRRISTPAYGGDDVDRRNESVQAVRIGDDGMSVQLGVDNLREGFVYEFRLHDLVTEDQLFFPAEAYYTLRVIPTSHSDK